MKLRYWTVLLGFILLAFGLYNSLNPYDLKFVNIKNIPQDVTFVCVYSTDAKNHTSLMNFYIKELFYEDMDALDCSVGAVRDTERGQFQIPIQWRTAARWGFLCQTRDKKWMIAPVEIRPSAWVKTIVVRFETLQRSQELPPDLKRFVDEETEKERKWRQENIERFPH